MELSKANGPGIDFHKDVKLNWPVEPPGVVESQ